MEDIEIIKKRCAVFALENEGIDSNELTDTAISYLKREIDGDKISTGDWMLLHEKFYQSRKPYRDLDRRFAFDMAFGKALPWNFYWSLSQDSARFLLPLVDEIVPTIEKTDVRLLNDITENGFALDTAYYHNPDCNTAHCVAGFFEIYGGEKGKYLVEHFGNWTCAALIDLKNNGSIRDFFASNEDALETIKENAAKQMNK